MKINNFRGDLTNIPAKKEPLLGTRTGMLPTLVLSEQALHLSFAHAHGRKFQLQILDNETK